MILEDRIKTKNVFYRFFSEIYKNKFLYLMTVPGILFFLLFCYWPMAGVIVAFKDFKVNMGMFGSPWVGFNNFKFLFISDKILHVTMNTLYLNVMFFVFQHFFALLTAIFLNEITSKLFKRISQTVIFFPYFVSWVVVSAFSYNLFADKFGLLAGVFKDFGLTPVSWNQRADLWPAILVLFTVWKYSGYLSVVYIAAITNIDPEYFESTALDGATKLQQIWYVTLPLIKPTIVLMILLSVGRIFFADFGAIYGLVGDNSSLFSTTDVIDTYVFRALRQVGDVGMSSAAGLYQSVIGFIFVFGSNIFVRKFSKENALF